jgi:hypothetical protein
MDKVEMEDTLHHRVGSTGRTRVVCRTGNPIVGADLARAAIETAKSVIVLSPDADDPDSDVIKTILAITNAPGRHAEPYHIVAQLRDRENLPVARIAGRGEAQLVVVGDLIARITAQTCRQSGLSAVYQGLLDFEGDEIYPATPPSSLVGRPFQESLFAYDTSSVIGLLHANGTARLNPPMDMPVKEGDRLLAISADDDTVLPAPSAIRGQGAVAAPPQDPKPRRSEQTLVLGWNRRGPAIAAELDNYVAHGSTLVVAATPIDLATAAVPEKLAHTSVETRTTEPWKREALTGLLAEGFDHVIVLCSDMLEPQRADARTLVTLINLRDIVATTGSTFSITSEMLDLENRALAEVTHADDFIVSDRLASLLVCQLSEHRHLKAVFDDLFDSTGSEIYLRPAASYVPIGKPVAFATALESSVARGEIAIGYRTAAHAGDAMRNYGVVINPTKSRETTFAAADKVIVLAGE